MIYSSEESASAFALFDIKTSVSAVLSGGAIGLIDYGALLDKFEMLN